MEYKVKVCPIVCGGFVLCPCFEMQYLVSFLVLQSSCWGPESFVFLLSCGCFRCFWVSSSCCSGFGGRGGGGQNIGFLCNTAVRTLEKSQSYQASIQCWAIIGPPAKYHLMPFHGMPGHWWPAFNATPHKKAKKPPKSLSWTPSGKTFWIRTWGYNDLQCVVVAFPGQKVEHL